LNASCNKRRKTSKGQKKRELALESLLMQEAFKIIAASSIHGKSAKAQAQGDRRKLWSFL